MWPRCWRILPHVCPAVSGAAAMSLTLASTASAGGDGSGAPRQRRAGGTNSLRGVAAPAGQRSHWWRAAAMACEEVPSQGSAPVISVGCYNVLCSTYAVKWGEREGLSSDGSSNWAARWPVMRGIMQRARWDVVCLQEVEHKDAEDIAAGLGPEYAALYFKHERRPPDGLMIAVRKQAFELPIQQHQLQHRGVAFARVDLVHRASGRMVRVLTAHCRGGSHEQLEALADFADEGKGAGNPDVTIVAGDFNEDFHTQDRRHVLCPLPASALGCYETLLREKNLPELSRPPNKQAADQSSGKGKVDFIFVRGTAGRCSVELFRDPASRLAVLSSHAACAATGEWPSDHGAEALSVRFSDGAAARL